MPQITEAGTLTRATERAGNMLIQLITPGQGSSGQYSAEVLQEAAKSRTFGAGTLMFADHPGEAESYDRPERSIRDVAGVLVEDARWDGTALVAEARTYEPWTKVLGEMADAIGVSIRATADVAEGVVTRLDRGISVDFVTAAGRGGKIREVYESARKDARLLVLDEARTLTPEAVEAERAVREASNVGQWVESRIHRDFTVMADDMAAEGRLTREERIGLSSAIGDALASFVSSLEASQPHLYERSPWADAPAPGATTDASESGRTCGHNSPTTPCAACAAMESHKPPVTPAGSTTETHESEEDTMQQIEESRLAQLEADAGRVHTLEAERDASNAERDTERTARLAAQNRAAAIEAIADSGHQFTALERRGLLADLPVNEAGQYDADTFTTALTEAATEARSTAGTGNVTGFGGNTDTSRDYASEADQATAGAFGRTVKGA